ncbi:MAG: hypothetical protein ABIJ83_03640 [Patescibacteria group bacterium]
MENLFYKFISYLPSSKGKKNLNHLLGVLRNNGIEIELKKYNDESGEYYTANSVNLSNKEIITSGKDLIELDHNIKDAIFTAYHVPAFYCDYNLIKTPLAAEQKNYKYATA